jgi:outer membrane protein assembly factor BamE (lipoprotein component of BamABCDE complex)
MSSLIIFLLAFAPIDVYADTVAVTKEYSVGMAILIISFLFSTFYFIFAIIINSLNKRFNKYQKMIINGDVLNDDQIKAIDSSLNRKDIILSAFETYKNLQHAWSDANFDDMRKLTTDELYNALKMQLEPILEREEKNVMSGIKLIGAGVLDIRKTNKVISVDVILCVNQYDYVINKKNRIIRGNGYLREETYVITLDKISDKKKAVKSCPNCGAKLKDFASQTCEYCSSNIIKESMDFVITEIKNVTREFK